MQNTWWEKINESHEEQVIPKDKILKRRKEKTSIENACGGDLK